MSNQDVINVFESMQRRLERLQEQRKAIIEQMAYSDGYEEGHRDGFKEAIKTFQEERDRFLNFGEEWLQDE